MNKKILSLSLLSILLITGCGGSDDDKDAIKFDLNYSSLLLKDPDTGNYMNFDMQVSYRDTCFDKSGNELNKKLMPLSLGQTLIHSNKEKTTNYFTTFGYSDIYFSSDYSDPHNKDSVKTVFAHKTIGEYEMFAVGVDGFDYGKGWVNNLVWGKEGNASGFQLGADKVRSNFNTYFDQYKSQKNKIWLTSYSRGAAIAGIFIEELLDDEVFADEDTYAYLFEAPSVMVEEKVKPHSCIKNIINHGDAVVNALPSKFGFIRPGVDVDIYDSKVDSIAKSYDSRLVLSKLVTCTYFNDEKSCVNYILNSVLAYDPQKEGVEDMSTREKYVDYYQDTFAYVIDLFLSLKSSTLAHIMNSISSMPTESILSLLSGDNLYNFIKGELDTCSETYDDEKLHSSCSRVVYFATTVNPSALGILYLYKDSFVSTITRAAQFHAPEIVVPLIAKYCK